MTTKTNTNFFGERFLNRLLYPRQVEDYMQLINPIWSSDKILGQVVHIEKETDDCTSITLRVNANWPSCTPGQHAMIHVQIDGKRYSRMFTISGHTRDTLTYTVKRNGDGLVSNWINGSARVGDVVEVSAPQGDFVLPENPERPVLMIAGGSGITPFWAMLQDMRDMASKRNVSLLYYSRTKEEAILIEPILELAKDMLSVDVKVVYTRQVYQIVGSEKPYFSPSILSELKVQPEEADIYVCGPNALIEAVETFCEQNDLSDVFHKEYFAPPIKVTAAEDVTVTFEKSNVVAQNAPGTLLEMAENAGLSPEYGCRMGICQTCTCKKVSGRVKNVLTDEILDEDVNNIQLCITAPVDSDIVLEL